MKIPDIPVCYLSANAMQCFLYVTQFTLKNYQFYLKRSPEVGSEISRAGIGLR